MALARVGLAEVFVVAGRDAEAASLLDAADEHVTELRLEGASAPKDDALSGRIQASRGSLARTQRRLEEAATAFEAALSSLSAGMGADHLDLAKVHSNLGLVHLEQHRFEEAVACLDRALALAEAAPGATALDVAAVRSTFAAVRMEEGRFEEALAHAEAALAARRRGLGEAHPLVGQEHNNLAVILQHLARYAERRNTSSEASRSPRRRWARTTLRPPLV
jgi:tetratricopeptide (TPR) repeat protein